MFFCLSMKAEKGNNIGRYYLFPGNFSSLWAILFSFPLKQSSLCVLQLKRKLTETMNVTQGAKKIIFTACHLGKLQKLASTSPDVISTSPKTFWLAELISQFFCYLNYSKNITCLSGKLKTELTSLIAKSTFLSPGLSDTTFFACCVTPLLIFFQWGFKKGDSTVD